MKIDAFKKAVCLEALQIDDSGKERLEKIISDNDVLDVEIVEYSDSVNLKFKVLVVEPEADKNNQFVSYEMDFVKRKE